MEIVRLMDCGDAKRRADNGAFFGLNHITSAAGTGVSAKTAAYTLTEAESGKAFSNSGASGSVTFTLPASPKAGMWYFFEKIANQNLVVAPGAGATIENGSSLTNSTSGDANKATLTVVATSTTTWKVQGYRGTWA